MHEDDLSHNKLFADAVLKWENGYTGINLRRSARPLVHKQLDPARDRALRIDRIAPLDGVDMAELFWSSTRRSSWVPLEAVSLAFPHLVHVFSGVSHKKRSHASTSSPATFAAGAEAAAIEGSGAGAGAGAGGGGGAASPTSMYQELHGGGRRVSDTPEDQAAREKMRQKHKRQRLAPTVEKTLAVAWSLASKTGGNISVAPENDVKKSKTFWKIGRLNKTKEEKKQFHIGRVYSVVNAGLSQALKTFRELNARKRIQLEEVTRYVLIPRENIRHVVQNGLHCINNASAAAAGSKIENQLCPKESRWAPKAKYGIVASKYPDFSIYNNPTYGAEYFVGEVMCLRPKTEAYGRAKKAKQFTTLEEMQAAPAWDQENGAYSYELAIGKSDLVGRCGVDDRSKIFDLTQEYFFSFSDLSKGSIQSRPTQISLKSIIRVVYGDAAAAEKIAASKTDDLASATQTTALPVFC